MSPIEKAAVMAFGAALAVVGIILFANKRGHTEGTNKIKFAKFEFELSTPSLFIFLIGCGLFVFPFFVTDSLTEPEPGAMANAPSSSLFANTVPAIPVSDEITRQRQAAMEAKLAELQSRLDLAERGAQGFQPPGASTASFVSPASNIAGRWNSATGSYYVVQQMGEDVAIQEFTNGVVSAVGEGTFDGLNLDASFQTLVGMVDVDLNLSSDRSRLSGQLTYVLTGGAMPFEMYR